jgi:hypothetical protein
LHGPGHYLHLLGRDKTSLLGGSQPWQHRPHSLFQSVGFNCVDQPVECGVESIQGRIQSAALSALSDVAVPQLHAPIYSKMYSITSILKQIRRNWVKSHSTAKSSPNKPPPPILPNIGVPDPLDLLPAIA